MYESFYGLKAKPFSMLPDPEFLYLGKKHRLALTLLEYTLMNNAGFCVISGEIGAGKTTLLRKLLSTLEENVTTGMITNTHQSFGELLDWVLSAFGIHQAGLSKVEMHQRFIDFLLEQYANNKTTLLIVDEAQNMPAATLEELRMLSNINSEKDLVLQVILAGQPDLKDTLQMPELKQFAQRISVDFHLDALDAGETCHYIQHRLVTAGATDDIFTPEACRLIAEYSGGVPRLINLLCDTALVYGFADQAKVIDAGLIEEMVSERMENSILPLVRADRKKKPGLQDDSEFPWINPNGGTSGLKPAAEKKTVEKTVVALEQASAAGTGEDRTPAQAKKHEPVAGRAGAAATGKRAPKQAGAGTATSKSQKSQKRNRKATNIGQPVAASGAVSQPAARRQTESAVDRIADHYDPADKRQFANRLTGFGLFLLALLLTLTAATFNYEVVVPDLPKNKLAEHEFDKKQTEIEMLKQDLSRAQQQAEAMQREAEAKQREAETRQRQAEAMQRERDAALIKARQEEQQRMLQVKAAQEAVDREKEAIAAAERAAAKALKAEQQASKLANRQRAEMKKLLDERDRLERERQQTATQQKLLKEQRQIIVLEWERLAKEKARVDQSTPDWSDSE